MKSTHNTLICCAFITEGTSWLRSAEYSDWPWMAICLVISGFVIANWLD